MILDDLKMYARFGWGLRSFLRHTISLEQAKEIVRRRMGEREKNFLRLVERGIFGYPRSPYLRLLKLAQVELGDIQRMVRSKGLENALHELREAGVYITFEEFKGRDPIVRYGKIIPVRARDFDNPHLSHYYQADSSGSTGAGTRVSIDLAHIAAQAPHLMLTRDAHGVLDVPTAIWRGILPDNSGILNILWPSHFGRIPWKWFSPIISGDLRPSLKYRLATRYIVVMARLHGARFPYPEFVGLDEAIVLAHWAVEILKNHGKCLIGAPVSRALRVCLAAREEGLNLAGATFVVAGEPPTRAKVQGITSAGARYFTTYGFAEAGRIGMGCAHPAQTSDLHFLKDAFAIVQSSRKVPNSSIPVPAFYFSSLLPTAPKLMLNVESDDYGDIESQSCGCPLESYGYTEHLRDIRSFRKLTGEGVTLVGSEMVRILEEVLPARFGGSPLDYQLIEEEDKEGFTRLNLLVSPRLEIVDEKAVVSAVLKALAQSSVASDSARAIWKQAGTLRVKRIDPIWTSRGKLMPLHLSRPITGSPKDSSL
jgi:hypothetical protein